MVSYIKSMIFWGSKIHTYNMIFFMQPNKDSVDLYIIMNYNYFMPDLVVCAF